MAVDCIYYEQPLNELVRICLRLEYLYNLLDYHLKTPKAASSHAALSILLDILQILDRPDIKTKFISEFRRYVESFQQFKENPKVDKRSLNLALEELNTLIELLQPKYGKFAHVARDDCFISTIRQYFLTPGGTCNADIPQYHYWLNLPPEKQHAYLKHWIAELDEPYKAVRLLLKLARDSTEETRLIAEDGFYQKNLSPERFCPLVRIGLERNIAVYPLMSLGRHRLVIHFYTAGIENKPQQAKENIPFILMD
ncbi:MAG: cell division protein ZapD [Gammaproteobacteria bacterium]|nr:cell division protein ZapD [Gammaproteobacteria bacterium]